MVVGIVNVIILTNVSMVVGQKTAAAEPAMLDIVEIYAAGCSNCYDSGIDVDEIKKQNTNVSQRSVEMLSSEAQSLINMYGIEKLPALVVTGEINKSASLSRHFSQVGTVRDNTVIIEAPVPYYSIDKQRTVGLVNITRILDTSCAQCTSIGIFVSSFESSGVVIGNDRNVEYNSQHGAALISEFGITRVPAVIVSGDILEYPGIAQIWSQLNATEKGGSYALHVLQAPYRDLLLGRVVGLVDVIYLNDSSCKNCYNVVLTHRDILSTSFGVFIANETIVDISSNEGKALVSKYGIKAVPVFVMSPDAEYYAVLMQVWPSVGTRETNGWYAFRNVTVLGRIYKDLATGTTIVPAG